MRWRWLLLVNLMNSIVVEGRRKFCQIIYINIRTIFGCSSCIDTQTCIPQFHYCWFFSSLNFGYLGTLCFSVRWSLHWSVCWSLHCFELPASAWFFLAISNRSGNPTCSDVSQIQFDSSSNSLLTVMTIGRGWAKGGRGFLFFFLSFQFSFCLSLAHVTDSHLD